MVQRKYMLSSICFDHKQDNTTDIHLHIFTELTPVKTQLYKLRQDIHSKGHVNLCNYNQLHFTTAEELSPKELLSDKVTKAIFVCVSRGESGVVISETCRREKRKKHGS